MPSSQCEIFIASIGCATAKPAPEAMAYSCRDAQYVLNVHGRWDTAEEDQHCIQWARDFFSETKPFASGGVYVNFLTLDESARIESAYGPTFARLQEIKKKYDPTNFFRMNRNNFV